MKKMIVKIRRSKQVTKLLKMLFWLLSKLSVQKKTVIFESFLGKQYSDSPKAIYQYMKKHYPTYKLIWSYDQRYTEKFENEDVEVVKRFTLKWFYLMATSKYWIVNSRLPIWIPKPTHTVYIQTWHGTPLKKLGLDIEKVYMAQSETITYKKEFVYEASKWDYLVSPNRYSTEIFKKAFEFKGKIIESGYPRNDVLYKCNNPEDILQLKRKYNLPLNKKIILYAPTWRDNEYKEDGTYIFHNSLNIDKMQRLLGEEYILLFRTHYLVAQQLDLEAYKDFAFDLSHANDISDLYLMSDILITDYSSVFFDYANLQRPMIFYTYDLEVYRDDIRGFYFNLEKEAPGPVVSNFEDLLDTIIMLDHTDKKDFDFYQEYCYLEDGHATERVVKYIFEECT